MSNKVLSLVESAEMRSIYEDSKARYEAVLANIESGKLNLMGIIRFVHEDKFFYFEPKLAEYLNAGTYRDPEFTSLVIQQLKKTIEACVISLELVDRYTLRESEAKAYEKQNENLHEKKVEY